MFSDTSRYCTADFSAWEHLRRDAELESLRFLSITPCEKPDLSLARAFSKQASAIAIDIGRDPACWEAIFSGISLISSSCCGIRIPDHVEINPDEVPDAVAFVILGAECELKKWRARFPVVVQVTSLEQAKSALAGGALGLIAKGPESGGQVGDESSFILLQRILELKAASKVPVWCQGGIGFHSAAGAFAGGAFGVVLDSQLALLA
ncbi:MAG TPA: nitronate monooxygenase, partial [Acidobacteriota bacterium]